MTPSGLVKEEAMVQEGKEAPVFCLAGFDEQGLEREICLAELLDRKKKVVLYFYPKDNTPGCTAEACDFRDSFNRLMGRATVVGVSRDSLASHRSFRTKNGLNFILLSDPDHKVLEAYGAWGEKKMYGKTSMGIVRSTFLITEKGIIAKVWPQVKVKGHVDEVIDAVDSVGKKG